MHHLGLKTPTNSKDLDGDSKWGGWDGMSGGSDGDDKDLDGEDTVKTHCLFGSSGALFLARTHVLKVEPEEDVGEGCEEVTNNEQGEDTKDINDGQGRAVRGRAM